jgi:dipeptidyl-peptidase 9
MDAKIGGQMNNLVSFIRKRDLWVTTTDGVELRLTFSESEHVTNGAAEYIMQEEFHRFTGYWWAPSQQNIEENNGGIPFLDMVSESGQMDDNQILHGHFERILYLEVDESNVEVVCIARAGLDGDVDRYPYPRPGKPNAMSEPFIVSFIPRRSHSESVWAPTRRKLWGRFALRSAFPWLEYIVRLGWIPSGTR